MFLGSWSATLNVVLAIPTSIIGTFIVLYFFGFTLTLLLSATSATALGFLAGDLLPPLAKLAFVFMSPMYFLLLLSGGPNDARGYLAIAGGAIAGPLVHLVAPQWSVLVAGFLGGTLAYAGHRAWQRSRRAP